MSYYSDEHIQPPEADNLEITVFGPGYGESVVLYVPVSDGASQIPANSRASIFRWII